MYDIISIGDTTLDVFLQVHDATVNCTLDTKFCQLCVNYSEKIPVQKITEVAGVGSAANTAVGSARLGLKTALYTIIGDDYAGKDSLKVFKQESVATKYIKIDKKNRTDYSTVVSFKGERTILTYHSHKKYSLPVMDKTKWLYLSSLSEGHKLLYSQIVKKVKKEKLKLGFNPGTYELKQGIELLKPMLALTTVFMVNKEEAWKLVGKIEDTKKLLTTFKEFGPEIVIITDGPRGAHAFDGKDFYFQDIFDLPAVERTGAGDAFATAVIAGIINGLDLREALRWGAANAAAVIQKIGAREGLLSKKGMSKFLKEHPEPHAMIF